MSNHREIICNKSILARMKLSSYMLSTHYFLLTICNLSRLSLVMMNTPFAVNYLIYQRQDVHRSSSYDSWTPWLVDLTPGSILNVLESTLYNMVMDKTWIILLHLITIIAPQSAGLHKGVDQGLSSLRNRACVDEDLISIHSCGQNYLQINEWHRDILPAFNY